MKDKIDTLPKTIWMFWSQGFDKIPYLVEKCYYSWKEQNPEWEIIFLDQNNYTEYVDLTSLVDDFQSVQIQHFADLLRINLLAKYGGVWADATLFCTKPLDTWIHDYTSSGFFTFRQSLIDRTAKDKRTAENRLICNWFLASYQECPLTITLCQKINQYWIDNQFFSSAPKSWQLIVAKVLDKLLNGNLNTTKYWFSDFVTKVAQVYPYFWFHYLFTRCVEENSVCSKIWNQTPTFTTYLPHLLKRHGMNRSLNEEVKQVIDSKSSPLFKLNWRLDLKNYDQNNSLYYLLNMENNC